MASIPELIWVSVKPVLKIFIASAGGAILTRAGVLDGWGLKLLSKVCVYFLSPALLFSKTVAGISVDKIDRLGLIVMMALLYITIGFSAGFLIRRFCKLPQNFSYAAIAVAAWGNWGDIPLALIMSLGDISPFHKGDTDVGVAYASIFLAVFYFTMWGAGYKLFQWDFPETSKQTSEDTSTAKNSSEAMEEVVVDQGKFNADEDTAISQNEAAQEHDTKTKAGADYEEKEQSFKNNPNRSGKSILARLQKIKEKLGFIFNPPNVALLIGFTIAMISPLKSLFVPSPSNSNPPLMFIREIADSVGMAAVPIVVVLPGYP
ncbi:uncharacterized protein VTP21DRAFT_7874 [Calcarisporiella thermophila]|uniref:uncharacterized protein n=1 Tax=Calcarisporiella thermophila TaxID=911321 RepID=UPI003744A76C